MDYEALQRHIEGGLEIVTGALTARYDDRLQQVKAHLASAGHFAGRWQAAQPATDEPPAAAAPARPADR